jgi:FixJ family two-component response regulator
MPKYRQMIGRVLLVDDEEPLLKAYRRFLQPNSGDETSARHRFDIETMSNPEAALERVAHHGPYATVVSDYKMPGLDGVRFLERVKAIEPSTVRVMLTGAADVDAAIESVNRGAVFRFLTKPCLPATLRDAVEAALRQHQLIVAERELLEHTVSGVVRVLMDTLTVVNPMVSTKSFRVRRCVRHMVKRLGLTDAWQLEVAAMLSQIGSVVLGTDVPTAETVDHPALAQQLLGHIPRFEEVAAIIARQTSSLEPGQAESPFAERDRVRLGGQVLRAALEFEAAMSAGASAQEAVATLSRRRDLDAALVACLADVDDDLRTLTPRTVAMAGLQAGMILDQDVKGSAGVLIMARGHEVTAPMLARIHRMASADWLRTTVKVLVSQVPEFEPLPRWMASEPVAPPETRQ